MRIKGVGEDLVAVTIFGPLRTCRFVVGVPLESYRILCLLVKFHWTEVSKRAGVFRVGFRYAAFINSRDRHSAI